MSLWEFILFFIFCLIPGIKGDICIDASFIFLVIQFHFMIEHMRDTFSRRKYEYCQILFIIWLFSNIIPEAYFGYKSAIGGDISIGIVVITFIIYAVIIHCSYKHIKSHKSDHDK